MGPRRSQKGNRSRCRCATSDPLRETAGQPGARRGAGLLGGAFAPGVRKWAGLIDSGAGAAVGLRKEVRAWARG